MAQPPPPGVRPSPSSPTSDGGAVAPGSRSPTCGTGRPQTFAADVVTVIEVRFIPGRHHTAPLAVRLAQDLAPSSGLGDARLNDPAPGEVRVAIAAPGPLLGRFCALWSLVAAWPGSQLWLDGHPLAGTHRWRLTAWLQCLVRAQAFPVPARYCRSAPVPPGVPLPWLPCRLWASGWIGRVEWEVPDRARDQVRAGLAEAGVLGCPVLDLPAWERMVGQSPAERLIAESFPSGDLP